MTATFEAPDLLRMVSEPVVLANFSVPWPRLVVIVVVLPPAVLVPET